MQSKPGAAMRAAKGNLCAVSTLRGQKAAKKNGNSVSSAATTADAWTGRFTITFEHSAASFPG
jgi:hypothetical protein